MARKVRLLALLTAVVLLAGCGPASKSSEADMGPVYTGPLPEVAVVPPLSTDPACRQGNPLANVYHPQRLQLVQRCALVTGSVILVRHEADGDHHIDVKLDPAYADLVNERNKAVQGGALVVEIVPADAATVKLPRVGDRVQIVGPYVLDKDHGWMEIHPAWSLRVLGG